MSEKCVYCKDCKYYYESVFTESECRHPSNIETKTHAIGKSWKSPKKEFKTRHAIKSPKVKNMNNDCAHFDNSFNIKGYSVVLSIIVSIILIVCWMCWVLL